jgi:hypothetical protein
MEHRMETTTWNTRFIEALDADTPLEQVTAIEAGYKPKRVPKPKKIVSHVMADGENILTIAAMYLPWGMTRKEYAEDLAKRNRNWNTGALINL